MRRSCNSSRSDHEFEWEVVTRSAILHGGKSLRARIRRPGLPESERDMTWPAHVKSGDSAGRQPTMNQLPYLLPWVRVLFLVRSIASTDWDDTTGRLVQPLLRRALEMRRQIARDGWWN
jgi:hypothetical protein